MGGLFYPNITPVVWIGTKSGTTCTPVTLTTAYTDNKKSKAVSGMSEMTFDVSYTTGSGETATTLSIILEDSVENTNFYQLTNEAASAGTSVLTQRTFTFAGAAGSTTYKLSYRIDISYKFVRLSVKETGANSNAGTVFIEGVLAGN